MRDSAPEGGLPELAALAERVRLCESVGEVLDFTMGAREWMRGDWDEVVLDKVRFDLVIVSSSAQGCLGGGRAVPQVQAAPGAVRPAHRHGGRGAHLRRAERPVLGRRRVRREQRTRARAHGGPQPDTVRGPAGAGLG